MRARSALAALLAALALAPLAACTTPQTAPSEDASGRADAPGVMVLYRPSELEAAQAQACARLFASVRQAVTHELGLDATPSEVPEAEVVVYRDPGWGQDYFLVTHAQILDNPLRVHIPCRLPPEDTEGERIAARFRGTVAHELAEATVLTHVPMLDPYLRWMHDGIAESVSYRVLAKLDPQAAAEERDRYLDRWRQARDRKIRWVDLTGWRQQADWVVHSEALFADKQPLRLGDPAAALSRLADERFASQEQHPDQIATLDALAGFLAEAWTREHLPPGEGEVDLTQPEGRGSSLRAREFQFLCYGASMCIWLELEQKQPGVTGKVLAAIMARHATVLRSADVLGMIEQLANVEVRPRLERFTVDRLEKVLAAEAR